MRNRGKFVDDKPETEECKFLRFKIRANRKIREKVGKHPQANCSKVK